MESLLERMRSCARHLKDFERGSGSELRSKQSIEMLRRSTNEIKRLEEERRMADSRQGQLSQLLRDLDAESSSTRQIVEQITRDRELLVERLNAKRRMLSDREAELSKRKAELDAELVAIQNSFNEYVKLTGMRIELAEKGQDGRQLLRLVFNENEIGNIVLEFRDDVLLISDEKSFRVNPSTANLNNTTLQNVGLTEVEGFRLVRCDPSSCFDALVSTLTAFNADKIDLGDFVKQVRSCLRDSKAD